MDLPCSSLLHSDVKGPEDGFELKKERRERPSVRKSLEADILNSNDAPKDKLQHTEQDTQRVGQDLLTNSQDQKSATDKWVLLSYLWLLNVSYKKELNVIRNPFFFPLFLFACPHS